MYLKRFALATACLVLAAAPVDAQAVKIEFRGGLVSLTAQNATPRQILAEWVKVGGTRIVNAEGVPGGPMTIELVGVSERQALDVVLRGASGYMAAARTTGTGASGLDRVHVLPTSTAPAARPGAPAPVPVQQVQRPPIMNDIIEDALDDLDDDAVEQPGARTIQTPAGAIRIGPGTVVAPGTGRPAATPPFPFPLPRVPPPAPDEDEPPPAAVPGTNNPFGGVPGTSQPGVFNPPPAQPGGPNTPRQAPPQ